MAHYPLWFLSLYIFVSVFNLSISLVLTYLRLKSGSERYAKSQLWALSILAFLFFLNFLITIYDTVQFSMMNTGEAYKLWYLYTLKWYFVIFTASLLLAFGLTYPKPATDWRKLRWIIIAVFALGIGAVLWSILEDHYNHAIILGLDRISVYYSLAVFIPVFIWLSAYSRQPSKEARMMYAIFIWGFVFVYFSDYTRLILLYLSLGAGLSISYMLLIGLLLLFTIRLGHTLWINRKRWSSPETLHVALLASSILLGVLCMVLSADVGFGLVSLQHRTVLADFIAHVLGWVLLRPILFSYGLLRFRLLGTQVRAERALAIVIGVLASTFLGLLVANLLFPIHPWIGVCAGLGTFLALIYPSWRISERIATRQLTGADDTGVMSMRRRRNIYLMGLQAAVVRGRIDDEWDREALGTLKKELGITDREHDLLMESITMQETRLEHRKDVDEVYLIHQHGLLISAYREKATGQAEGEESDSDIFAGMFTAITEFVKETMEKGGGKEGASTTDTIAYGPSSLAIEREGPVIMAALVSGAGDLELRQLMRDTLAEIHEGWGHVLTEDWDGDLNEVQGIEKVLREFAGRVKRRA